jgi:hypothetical protein
MDGVETEIAVNEVSELRQQIEKLLTDKKNKRSETPDTPDVCRKRRAGDDERNNYFDELIPSLMKNLFLQPWSLNEKMTQIFSVQLRNPQ